MGLSGEGESLYINNRRKYFYTDCIYCKIKSPTFKKYLYISLIFLPLFLLAKKNPHHAFWDMWQSFMTLTYNNQGLNKLDLGMVVYKGGDNIQINVLDIGQLEGVITKRWIWQVYGFIHHQLMIRLNIWRFSVWGFPSKISVSHWGKQAPALQMKLWQRLSKVLAV